MPIKKYKPVTATQRNRVSIDFTKEQIFRGRPVKILTARKKNKAGRNNQGQISSFHRGGGHKNLYRLIDTKRAIFDIQGSVIRIEYDPNRTSYIALVAYTNGMLQYIIAPLDLKVGDQIKSSLNEEIPIKKGNTLPLKNIPIGTPIHNIELKTGRGGQVARAAGCFAKIIKKELLTCTIRLNSGHQMELSSQCLATIGIVSNIDHSNIKIGKAGRSRWLNKRPTVRGVVMNPVDHPHGGGEGKTSGGRCSVTPWGIPTKGYKTRRKKTSKLI